MEYFQPSDLRKGGAFRHLIANLREDLGIARLVHSAGAAVENITEWAAKKVEGEIESWPSEVVIRFVLRCPVTISMQS